MRAVQGQQKEGLVVGNRYEIEALLGIGALGAVYSCRDLRGEKSKLVIKTMSFIGADFEDMEVLCRNLSLLQRLRHPNIVRVLDFGIIENSGEVFLVEERVYGVDLYSATEDMECQRILSLVVELCKGLQYLHSQGIVFGNLKPSSVFLPKNERRGERLKLLDFNFRNQIRKEVRHNGQGALSYAAPEILMGGSANNISDMYALGVLIYQLLSRHLPFEDEDAGFLVQKQLQGSVDMRPIERLRNGIHLAQLLRCLLEKDPAKRMASAREAIAFISSFCGTGKRNEGVAGKCPACEGQWKRMDSFCHGRGRFWKIPVYGGIEKLGASGRLEDCRGRMRGMRRTSLWALSTNSVWN
jgi:serine/threonine protein kinase